MDSLNVNRHIMNVQRNFAYNGGYNMYSQPISMPIFQMQMFIPQSNFSSLDFQAPIFNFNQAPKIDNNLFVGNTLSNIKTVDVNPTYNVSTVPMFQLTLPKFTSNKVLTKKVPTGLTFDTNAKYKSLIEAGYNKNLAQKLAKDVASHVESSSTGNCAKYVSDSLERLGIVGARGNAYELRDSLRNNPHFKEVDPASVDIKNLPAGCILVYQKGAAGYSSKYGHVEITLGNGTAASDFINSNLKTSSNMNIFVPVMA